MITIGVCHWSLDRHGPDALARASQLGFSVTHHSRPGYEPGIEARHGATAGRVHSGRAFFSTWAIYPALHLAPVDLRAVCDRDATKAETAARKFGAPRSYTDHHAMWENEDLEAVIVWMKPRERQALVLEALEAGYHVLVPKPPAPSLDDCLALADASTRTGKSLMVHFHRRFSLGVTKALEIMARPSFGQVTQVSCSFCSGVYDEVRGVGYGGPVHAFLLDFAVHHIDLARALGGEVSHAAAFHDERDGGASVAVALRFAGGAVGTLQLTSQRVWWRNYHRVEITGQGESIVLDGLWGFRHTPGTRTPSGRTIATNAVPNWGATAQP